MFLYHCRMADVSSPEWKHLADQKEKEWKGILESRIETLESQCAYKEKELLSERAKFTELKEHFKYNLKLIEERDCELAKYDTLITELRTQLGSRNAEISELRIHLDDLQNVIKREEKTRDELQQNYQRRLKEKQAEIDAYKCLKDGEVQKEREEYEQFRRNLQRQLMNVQNELDLQKRELTTEFENTIKKREHEFKVNCDELTAKVLEFQLKLKLLEKELELTKDSNDKTAAIAEESESTQRELHKLVKHKEWELADITAIKDSHIKDLENKLSSCEVAMKKLQEDCQRKYTEMEKMMRDRGDKIEQTRKDYLEKEQALQAVIQELQSKLDDSQIKERQITWSNQDLVKEKDMLIEKLQEEVKAGKERWDSHIAGFSRETANRDFELDNALAEQRRLKLELEQRKEDLARYKSELKAATEREAKLNQKNSQLELNWQRRCEDAEGAQYDKTEDLIKILTSARDEAQALAKERERELHHKILLIKSLCREKDQLRALFKKHDIPLDHFMRFSLDEKDTEMNSNEDLLKQNAELKHLIAEMRVQMESLGQEARGGGTKVFGLNETSSVFQTEDNGLIQGNPGLRNDGKQSRKLLLDDSAVGNKEEFLSQVGNPQVKKHIHALNGAVGSLRSEKVELAAEVKKQQARIAYLENSLDDTSKQARQKQIKINQLNYELNSSHKRHEEDVTSLKDRISELELQLSEARREADEYHRASLERNEELVALGNQLSVLKMEMSDSSSSVNFGAQELYIQQLQGELNNLRKRATSMEVADIDNLNSKCVSLGEESSSPHSVLKHKLKSAASKIIQLARENQLLMESNNRLRAELKAETARQSSDVAKYDLKQGKTPSDTSCVEEKDDRHPGKLQDRLNQLEKLQYQLTKQELQFAHRFKTGCADGKSLKSVQDFNERRVAAEKDKSATLGKAEPLQLEEVLLDQHSTSMNLDPQMVMSVSSMGNESIQQVWQMLEDSMTSSQESCLPALTLQNIATGHQSTKPIKGQASDKSYKFYLDGKEPPKDHRYILSGKQESARNVGQKYAGNIKKPQSKIKVRNYNVRDTSGL